MFKAMVRGGAEEFEALRQESGVDLVVQHATTTPVATTPVALMRANEERPCRLSPIQLSPFSKSGASGVQVPLTAIKPAIAGSGRAV